MPVDNDASPFRNRFQIVVVLLAAAALFLVFRYAQIMLFGSPDIPGSTAPSRLERGPILDRSGRIMAIQTQLDTVSVWKPALEDRDEVVRALSDILGQDSESLRTLLAIDRDYVVVQRTITPTQSARIRAHLAAEELSGVQLEPDQGRAYPEREAAAALVGYVGIDNVGLSGIEYMFNAELAPPPGDTTEKVVGNQVFLTIDLTIQAHVDSLTNRLLTEHQADAVMLIVMEARTGAILAYSFAPTFDPNHFTRYDREERRNLPISKIYEPGSVLKVFSVSSFLELGGITPYDLFETSGGYVADGGAFQITDLGDYGTLRTEEIIKYSSNVGAAYASETVDAEDFYLMLTRFGFGRETGIAVNGEERGLLAIPERWSPRSQQTIAIGQEVGVTAVQMAAAATAIANEGVLLRPQIVDRIVSPAGRTLQRFDREAVHQVIGSETARTMLEMMYDATQADGTARRIVVPGVRVSAKTGTAEVFDPEANAYSDEHYLASTLAIVPTDDPDLIVYLVIDHPRGESTYGGRIAAPAVGELINILVPYRGIPQAENESIVHSGVVQTPEFLPMELGNRLPNLIGAPKIEVLELLTIPGVELYIKGNGWVVRQDPPPGTVIEEGMSISVGLE